MQTIANQGTVLLTLNVLPLNKPLRPRRTGSRFYNFEYCLNLLHKWQSHHLRLRTGFDSMVLNKPLNASFTVLPVNSVIAVAR